jgi:hypothetical protein
MADRIAQFFLGFADGLIKFSAYPILVHYVPPVGYGSSVSSRRARLAATAPLLLGNCSPAADKLQNQHDQCNQKQNVDVRAQHVEANEAQQP